MSADLRRAASLMREDSDSRWSSVADWLDFMAWQAETFGPNMSPFLRDHERRAIAVARTYADHRDEWQVRTDGR